MASGQGVAFCGVGVTEFMLEPPFLSQSLSRVKDLCGDTLGEQCLQCHLASDLALDSLTLWCPQTPGRQERGVW